MVSIGAFFGIAITFMITLCGPVVLAFLYIIKNKGKSVWKALLLGAVGFYLFQIQLRIPVINAFGSHDWFQQFAENNYIVYCLILALTAALVEVVARFIVAKCLQKELSYQHGIAAGLGHGGIEAVLLVGMTYLNNLLFAVLINIGIFDKICDSTMIILNDAKASALNDMLCQIKYDLIETSDYLFYLAGYERILCVLFHVAMSLLVCYMVHKKKTILGVGIAFMAHFFVDFLSPIVNGLATPYLGDVISQEAAYAIIYVFLTLVAVGAVVMIRKIGKMWKNEEENG